MTPNLTPNDRPQLPTPTRSPTAATDIFAGPIAPGEVEPLLLKLPDVARILGVCERIAWDLGKTGEIQRVEIGRSVLYSVESLRNFVRRGGAA